MSSTNASPNSEKLKFTRNKYDSLDGQVKVRFTLENSEKEFYIEASRRGVEIKGQVMVEGLQSSCLEPIAKAIGDAWKEHKKLKPNLSLNLAGH